MYSRRIGSSVRFSRGVHTGRRAQNVGKCSTIANGLRRGQLLIKWVQRRRNSNANRGHRYECVSIYRGWFVGDVGQLRWPVSTSSSSMLPAQTRQW